uniref:Uncharacterized protein n=1 Tax=Timema shepardi TaxID=629360 RepID=A0A7R9AQ33_TIMSH|nr:unnamed protein product [Timema shepardi]
MKLWFPSEILQNFRNAIHLCLSKETKIISNLRDPTRATYNRADIFITVTKFFPCSAMSWVCIPPRMIPSLILCLLSLSQLPLHTGTPSKVMATRAAPYLT